MRTIKLSILAIAVFAISTFIGCTKGNNGEQGPAGPAGPSGTSNISVTNASVLSGSWTASSSNYWTYDSTGVIVPTSDVCVVFYSSDDSAFSPMPVSNAFYAGDRLTYIIATGFPVKLTYDNPSGVPIAQTIYYNIADIPPAQIHIHPKTNWRNYTEVSQIPGVKIMSGKVH